MTVVITALMILAMLGSPKYDMSNVTVYYNSHETINMAWRVLGGQSRHKEVRAFAFYNGDSYFIFFPYNPSAVLRRHEYDHIREWKKAERRGR